MKKFLFHPLLLILAGAILFGFLGPALISAANDVAVLSGLVILFFYGFWVAQAMRFYIQKFELSNTTSNKE